MESTGARLREVRETRGMSLEQIAEATGVGLPYLEAMEAGNFDALPGRAFGKLYIRAYAEVLAFDPQPLIDLYDRERRGEGRAPETARPAPAGSRPVAEAIARWKAARSDVVPESAEAPPAEPDAAVLAEAESEGEPSLEALVPEPEPPLLVAMPAPDPPSPPPALAVTPRFRRSIVVGGLLVAAIAVAIVVAVSRRPPPTTAATAPIESPRPQAPPPAPANKSETPAVATPAPAPPVPPKASSRPAGPPSDLTVPESGLGRRVVSGRLEGEGTEFREGDVVCFQTRVLGGRRGDAIRHVWIYEGRAQQSIPLRVNDADWRTHSSKTIYKSGSWSVEARDAAGRVLASAAFTCRGQ